MDAGEGWRVYSTPAGELRVYTHPCVYEPAEDSFLAIRALSFLAREGYSPRVVVDAGTGTGILALAASRLFPAALLLGVDINPYAVEAARRTLQGAGASLLLCRWLSCIKGPVDLVVVNPPYLPVMDEVRECRELALAWSGAPGVLEDACKGAARISRVIVMVYSSLSNWDAPACLEGEGFRVVKVFEESYFMEKLYAVVAERGG